MPDARDDGTQLDIRALLSVALEQRPRDDMSERIMSRVAAMETVMEFARLLGAAPFHWLTLAPDVEPDVEPDDESDDDNDDDDDDDAGHDPA